MKMRSITQDSMLTSLQVAQLKVIPEKLAQKKFWKEMISSVLEEENGELMEYLKLMNNPK